MKRRTQATLGGLVVAATVIAVTLFLAFPSGQMDDTAEFREIVSPTLPTTSAAPSAPSVPQVSEDNVSTLNSSATAPEAALDAWLEAPSVMEALVLAQVQHSQLPATRIDPVECTATECQIRFTSLVQEPYRDGIGSFIGGFREPPIGAVDARWGFETTDAGYEYTVTLSSYEYERPQREPGEFIVTAQVLRERAADTLAADDFNAAPEILQLVSIGDTSAFVLVENVCAYDCASDGRQMIHIRVPEGATCSGLRGIEQEFLARTSSGGLEERTFCVPNTLVGN